MNIFTAESLSKSYSENPLFTDLSISLSEGQKMAIIAPNGSGKTTFAETYINNSKSNIAFLNPDLIASGFGTNDFEKASFQAGRVLLAEIKDKINRGESFAFESTLSGLTYARIIKQAKLKGYKIINSLLLITGVRHPSVYAL